MHENLLQIGVGTPIVTITYVPTNTQKTPILQLKIYPVSDIIPAYMYYVHIFKVIHNTSLTALQNRGTNQRKKRLSSHAIIQELSR